MPGGKNIEGARRDVAIKGWEKLPRVKREKQEDQPRRRLSKRALRRHKIRWVPM